MHREVVGTVLAVSKQWWLKVNRSPVRLSGADGAQYPHVVRFRYEVDGKTHINRQWFPAGARVPSQGSAIRVRYEEAKPSKATALF